MDFIVTLSTYPHTLSSISLKAQLSTLYFKSSSCQETSQNGDWKTQLHPQPPYTRQKWTFSYVNRVPHFCDLIHMLTCTLCQQHAEEPGWCGHHSCNTDAAGQRFQRGLQRYSARLHGLFAAQESHREIEHWPSDARGRLPRKCEFLAGILTS